MHRVWFSGGYKREYCLGKILEYPIWIIRVTVKEAFGVRFPLGSHKSRVCPGGWCCGDRRCFAVDDWTRGLQSREAHEQVHAFKHMGRCKFLWRDECFSNALLNWIFQGPHQSQAKLVSLFKWELDRNAQQGGGHESCLRCDSITGGCGREAFAYLSFQFYYIMLATFLRQYFFVFNGKP